MQKPAASHPARTWLYGLYVIGAMGAGATVHAADSDLATALTGGKLQLSLRARIEDVDDQALARNATATTFRARLGYETRAWNHFSALFEVDHLGVLGPETFNSTRNGRTDRPTIADPPATDLNQAALKVSLSRDELVIGRQRLNLDNQRFIGGSAWRQNEQTFDALTWRSRQIPSTLLTLSYIDNVNRVYGPDPGSPPPDLRSHSFLAHAALDLKSAGKLSLFGHWFDLYSAPANSHQNLGLLWTGSRALGNQWTLPWSASYVRQQDYAGNPVHYSARYYQLELGAARPSWGLRAGIEALGGDAALPERRFQTPLATLHAYQGWADKFLATPPQGVRDFYLAANARLNGVEAQLAWHDFRADAVSRSYGSEWDASVSRKFGAHCELLLKLARYDASGFAADTRKLWLQLLTSFP
jgi:hypothetical protein